MLINVRWVERIKAFISLGLDVMIENSSLNFKYDIIKRDDHYTLTLIKHDIYDALILIKEQNSIKID